MVKMTAKALVEINAMQSEPALEHAVELVLIGHLLAGRLKRDGVCAADADFARVWRDHVVPIAASRMTEWQLGMCAEITAGTYMPRRRQYRKET